MFTMHLLSETPFVFDIENFSNVGAATGSVTSDETDPQAVFFKDDGTKMYVVGLVQDTVFQYALGTAWDPSTKGASPEASFSVSAQDGQPQGLAFAADGMTMYVSGSVNEKVFQYTLTTAWDLTSGVSYSGKSLTVSGQGTNPGGIWLKPDGTSIYVVCDSNDTVFQYDMSTAGDLSTASYSGNSKSVSAQDSQVGGIAFTSDGLIMLMTGNLTSDVYQYDLGTAWNVGTANYASKFLNSSTEDSTMYDVFLRADDQMIFTVGSQNDSVYKYTAA